VGGVRYAKIGLAVGTVFVFTGAFLFRNAGDEALEAVALLGFILTFSVYHGLDERNKRRKRRGQ
jgi:uncharacterized membrane protein YfcA